MYKRFSLFCLLILVSTSLRAADDLKTILKAADDFRQQGDEVMVVTDVKLYKEDKLDKESLYNVFVKSDRRSLVVFKSAGEIGQKVLMLDDKYWIILPNTRRPIRITPMQKLLGEASVGDIATLTWGEDYDGKVVEKNIDEQGVKALKIDLHTVRKGTTYDRIELFLNAKDYFPIKANLYLKSGKLAKEAYYKAGTINGHRRVVTMTLIDRIKKQQKTIVNYQAMEPKTLADKYYNPAFLFRTDIPD